MGHYIMNVVRDYQVNISRLRTELSQYPCSALVYSVSSIYTVPVKIAPFYKTPHFSKI